MDWRTALIRKAADQARHRHTGDIWQVASHPKQWLSQVQGTESLYYRAIGSAEALMAKEEEFGQVWMKGVAGEMARKILRVRPN